MRRLDENQHRSSSLPGVRLNPKLVRFFGNNLQKPRGRTGPNDVLDRSLRFTNMAPSLASRLGLRHHHDEGSNFSRANPSGRQLHYAVLGQMDSSNDVWPPKHREWSWTPSRVGHWDGGSFSLAVNVQISGRLASVSTALPLAPRARSRCSLSKSILRLESALVSARSSVQSPPIGSYVFQGLSHGRSAQGRSCWFDERCFDQTDRSFASRRRSFWFSGRTLFGWTRRCCDQTDRSSGSRRRSFWFSGRTFWLDERCCDQTDRSSGSRRRSFWFSGRTFWFSGRSRWFSGRSFWFSGRTFWFDPRSFDQTDRTRP